LFYILPFKSTAREARERKDWIFVVVSLCIHRVDKETKYFTLFFFFSKKDSIRRRNRPTNQNEDTTRLLRS